MLFAKTFNLDLFPSSKEFSIFQKTAFKGGHLDFSHLTELRNIYITKIYMKKQCKSSIIKNHKITQKIFFDGVPLKGCVAS